jgi:hypothetical protein
MKQFIFSLPFALLSCLSLFAEEPGHITCRIVFLDRPANAPKALHLFDGFTSQLVDLPSMNLSKVYKLSAKTSTLTLLPEAVQKSDKLPDAAPTAVLPKGVTNCYLIVSSDPKNAVTPVSLQIAFPAKGEIQRGQTLWVNLTSHTINGTLGERELLVEPDSNKILEAPRNDVGDFPVIITYQLENSETQRAVCTTRWTHDPRLRNLGLIYPKIGSTAPRVSVFPDLRLEQP